MKGSQSQTLKQTPEFKLPICMSPLQQSLESAATSQSQITPRKQSQRTNSMSTLKLNNWIEFSCNHLAQMIRENIAYLNQTQNMEIKQLDFINNPVPHKLLLIDCRWCYEFEGGSIVSSINIWSGTDVQNFFENKIIQQQFENIDLFTDIVFFCQYSQHRSVKIMNYFKYLDVYKKYRNIYILTKGYDEFFSLHKDLTTTHKYVKELDEEHYQEHLLYSDNKQYLMQIPSYQDLLDET